VAFAGAGWLAWNATTQVEQLARAAPPAPAPAPPPPPPPHPPPRRAPPGRGQFTLEHNTFFAGAGANNSRRGGQQRLRVGVQGLRK
jgi:hypothetical protein